MGKDLCNISSSCPGAPRIPDVLKVLADAIRKITQYKRKLRFRLSYQNHVRPIMDHSQTMELGITNEDEQMKNKSRNKTQINPGQNPRLKECTNTARKTYSSSFLLKTQENIFTCFHARALKPKFTPQPRRTAVHAQWGGVHPAGLAQRKLARPVLEKLAPAINSPFRFRRSRNSRPYHSRRIHGACTAAKLHVVKR